MIISSSEFSYDVPLRVMGGKQFTFSIFAVQIIASYLHSQHTASRSGREIGDEVLLPVFRYPNSGRVESFPTKWGMKKHRSVCLNNTSEIGMKSRRITKHCHSSAALYIIFSCLESYSKCMKIHATEDPRPRLQSCTFLTSRRN